MDRLHKLVIAAALLLTSFAASAGYAYPNPPSGWGGAPGAWTFGGTPAANADWLNASARANVSVNVGGRAVQVPVAMRAAANAGSLIARRAITAHPLGRAISFINWATLAQWAWNEASQQWEVNEEGQETYQFLWKYPAAGGIPAAEGFTSASAACSAFVSAYDAWDGSATEWTYLGVDVSANGEGGTCRATQKNYICTVGGTYPGCSSDGNPGTTDWFTQTDSNRNHGTTQRYENPVQTEPERRPVTETDADELAADHPVPDAVLNEAQKHMPIPQDMPALNPLPFPGGIPTSIWNPLGEPYPFQDKWRQEGNTIKPAPSPSSPFRVDVIPEVKEANTPEELPDEPTTEPVPAEEPTDVCKENPNAAMCKPLGTAPPEPVIPTKVVPLAITPLSGFGPSTGSCPADRTATVRGGLNVGMSWQPFCQFADGIRPVVIAVAWISAILSFMGLSRKGSDD